MRVACAVVFACGDRDRSRAEDAVARLGSPAAARAIDLLRARWCARAALVDAAHAPPIPLLLAPPQPLAAFARSPGACVLRALHAAERDALAALDAAP